MRKLILSAVLVLGVSPMAHAYQVCYQGGFCVNYRDGNQQQQLLDNADMARRQFQQQQNYQPSYGLQRPPTQNRGSCYTNPHSTACPLQ